MQVGSPSDATMQSCFTPVSLVPILLACTLDSNTDIAPDLHVKAAERPQCRRLLAARASSTAGSGSVRKDLCAVCAPQVAFSQSTPHASKL